MRIIARSLEILLGLVFIATATLKALDMVGFAIQVRLYGVITAPALVRMTACGAVVVETLLGVLLIVGLRLRGWTLRATVVMLVGFTGLIAYAWAFNNLADCGCFGTYLKMGPGLSILKNVVMLAALGVIWLTARKMGPAGLPPVSQHRGWRRIRALAAALCIALVLMAALYGAERQKPGPNTAPPGQTSDATRPFAQFRFDADGRSWNLGEGRYLVALLSAECQYCFASVNSLNTLAASPDVPPLVGLVLGDEPKLDSFRGITGPTFPTVLIDPLVFMSLITKETPRLAIVQDGKSLHSWDKQIPELDEVVAAGAAAGAASGAELEGAPQH